MSKPCSLHLTRLTTTSRTKIESDTGTSFSFNPWWKRRSKCFSTVKVRCCRTNPSVSTLRAYSYEGLHYAAFAVSEYRLFRLAHANVIPELKPAHPGRGAGGGVSSIRFTPCRDLYLRSTSAMPGRLTGRLNPCGYSRLRVFRPNWRAGIRSVWFRFVGEARSLPTRKKSSPLVRKTGRIRLFSI